MNAANLSSLAGSKILSSLTKSQLQEIRALGKTITYRQNLMICQPDQDAEEIFILVQGKASLMQNQRVLTQIRPVTILFEKEVLLSENRSFGLFAETECHFLVIKEADLLNLLRRKRELQKKIYGNLLKYLVQKLNSSNHGILTAKSKNLRISRLIEEKEALIQSSSIVKSDGLVQRGIVEERDPEDELQEFNPSFEEKREFKRLQIQGNFSFAALDSIRIVCSLKDVGMGGFSASLDEGVFISPGENLTGKLILWEDVDPFDFVGSVRWSTQSLFGIEFTKISPRSRGKIKEFIENPPEMEK